MSYPPCLHHETLFNPPICVLPLHHENRSIPSTTVISEKSRVFPSISSYTNNILVQLSASSLFSLNVNAGSLKILSVLLPKMNPGGGMRYSLFTKLCEYDRESLFPEPIFRQPHRYAMGAQRPSHLLPGEHAFFPVRCLFLP